MNKFFPFHPLLFAIYPILFIFSHNINEIYFNQLIYPMLISIVATAILWAILMVILKDAFRASLMVTICLLSFFSYGHICEFIEKKDIFLQAHRHYQLLLIIFYLWAYLVYFIRRSKRDFININKLLNILSIILIFINISTIAFAAITANDPTPASLTDIGPIQPDSTASITTAYPDIYYIILDEYASLSTIRNVYHYNDDHIESFLKEHGFFIAQGSETRFASTWQSLCSSLNMNYVDKDISYKENWKSILNSEVSRYLKSKGYQFIYNSDQRINNGSYTNPYADVDFAALKDSGQLDQDIFSPFNCMLIKTSMLRGFYFKIVRDGLNHRRNELKKIDTLKKAVLLKGPKFVFSHHLISHQPFVFDADGGMVDSENHGNWVNLQYYLHAYIYTNSILTDLISYILDHSTSPPIIVIQSDHGPRGGMGIKTNPKKWDGLIYEWKHIFNAYYLPNGGNDEIYDSISPVNTFRVIFANYFGDQYPLLED